MIYDLWDKHLNSLKYPPYIKTEKDLQRTSSVTLGCSRGVNTGDYAATNATGLLANMNHRQSLGQALS